MTVEGLAMTALRKSRQKFRKLKVIKTTGYFSLLKVILTNSGEIPFPQSTDTTSDFLPFNFAFVKYINALNPLLKLKTA